MNEAVDQLAAQARDILGTKDGVDRVTEDQALYTRLVEIATDTTLGSEQKTSAFFKAYKAHDDLGRIRDEIRNPGENARIGYTPMVQMRVFAEKAVHLTKAVETEHGQNVIAGIGEKVREVAQLEDPSNLPEARINSFARAHGLRIPNQVSGFLNERANRKEATGRLLRAAGLVEEIDVQMRGLLEKGSAIAATQGLSNPSREA